jgi:RimJ/RimL family protein N-acetyltransferase
MTAFDFARLLKNLADIPRFVETRAMLLANRCEGFGLYEADAKSFVVRHKETGLIAVVGNPRSEAIKQATAQSGKQGAVLAFDNNFSLVAKTLKDWKFEKAKLYLLGDSPKLPHLADGTVRFLSEDEVVALTGLSEELQEELLIASKWTGIAAAILDNQPVSFCYAGAETETLWDVSIDTVAGFRHRGYAAMCVAFLIDYFDRKGKRPVWGAVESNAASMKLAAKLGFVVVDELFVFERTQQVS